MKEKYYSKYRTIGLKIGYYRKLQGLTQEQLAEKIDKKHCLVFSITLPPIHTPSTKKVKIFRHPNQAHNPVPYV